MAAEIYLVEGGTLFAVRSDGAYRSLSDGWGVVHSLALTTGRIWAMQQETIFLVDPAGGGDQVHSRGWGSGVKRLAATGDRVLLIDGRGRLFALELTGTYRYLSDGWEGVTAFCGTNGRFFAIDQGRLFEVFPDTGGNRFLSDGWGDVTACAGLAGQLYLVAKPGGTLFMQTEKTIFEKLGQPTRTDKNTAIYNSKPGELTIHFSSSGTVEQFWLTGEVKPLAVK